MTVETKILFVVCAAFLGLLGKMSWEWLQNLKEPSKAAMLEAMQFQQQLTDLDRRTSTLEVEIQAKLTSDVFQAHSEKLETIAHEQSETIGYIRGQLDILVKGS